MISDQFSMAFKRPKFIKILTSALLLRHSLDATRNYNSQQIEALPHILKLRIYPQPCSRSSWQFYSVCGLNSATSSEGKADTLQCPQLMRKNKHMIGTLLCRLQLLSPTVLKIQSKILIFPMSFPSGLLADLLPMYLIHIMLSKHSNSEETLEGL